MNIKQKIMVMFCILSWVFCAIGNLVQEHSIVGWWITFSGQILCLLAVLIVGVLNIIEFKKEEKELEKQIEENRKKCIELIENYYKLEEDENKKDKPTFNELRAMYGLPSLEEALKKDKIEPPEEI